MSEDFITESIAIIGLSGRFPGANNIDDFWNNLCKSKENITIFSDEELLKSGISKEQISNPNYVKSKGIINGIEFFDSAFFGLNPKEAEITDPQHRVFLECSWEALENAGYSSENYEKKIGVYGGSGFNAYYINNILPNKQLTETLGEFLIRIGNDKDFLTTKVSYNFNLTGPSFNIQSACSTSLVALCIACNQLLSYECDMALAGGVSIAVPQIKGTTYKDGLIISPDGQCRPFDSKATGTVISSGAGVVLLKRLEDAINEKDHIYAVIRGYGMNNDGSKKMTYSAPSLKGQLNAIKSAINMANINPKTIEYIETHGTGTILGDPVEIEALKQAFPASKEQYCAIGSVKSNIGHTFEAAGIIGLIKTVLTLYHKKIPASLNFNNPNPHIDFKKTPFYVNTALRCWEEKKYPRRAGVSSFGIGGTNTHVILEEHNLECIDKVEECSYPILITAKTLPALKAVALNLGKYLKEHPNISLGNVAYTLQVGRKKFDYQKILVCSNREEAVSKLLNFDIETPSDTKNISLKKNFKSKSYSRVPLPSYPFEKKRHWIDPPTTQKKSLRKKTESQSMENLLKSIWSEFLGIKSFDIHDNFFDLGGSSLLAIEIAARLSSELGLNLGMQTLLAYPTISKLILFISEQNASNISLLKLKSGSKGKPLVFIHPIEGSLFCFKSLIKELELPNPFYGIQGTDKNISSLEDLASFYISEIQKKQPKGPYYLVGASFGGIMAYEMARQLKEKNESIALLCILDASFPEGSFMTLSSDEARLTYLVEFLSGKSLATSKLTIKKVLQCLKLENLSSEEQKIIYNRTSNHLRLLSKYQPKPFEGNINLFISNNPKQKFVGENIKNSWKELIKGQVIISETAGKHLSMLELDKVEQLVKVIESACKKK
ncbi:MAG: hypothetical protein S4CHLAM7_07810 [Chlamydiae bacterium]|nr:hypothetical protein [Chlamydiota bacterium]